MNPLFQTGIFAMSCGIAAGLTPGPLLALVTEQTLKNGFLSGLRIAIAPAFTDIPIALFAVFILQRFDQHLFLGFISVLGALFLSKMAFGQLSKPSEKDWVQSSPGVLQERSLLKGIITNFLQPHPYLFWATIGAREILKGYETSFGAALVFPLSFISCIVGSKILVAVLIDRVGLKVSGRTYQLLLKALSLSILVFALLLFKEAFVLWFH